jgi:hypothetical protein
VLLARIRAGESIPVEVYFCSGAFQLDLSRILGAAFLEVVCSLPPSLFAWFPVVLYLSSCVVLSPPL